MAILEKCKYADDYKGIHPPKCEDGQPCKACIEIFLKERGWSQYYHEEYWVNQKVVEDPTRQNHTNYGMSLQDAFRYETGDYPKFKPMGLPALSMAAFPYDEENTPA